MNPLEQIEFQSMKERLARAEGLLSALVASDRYTVQKLLQVFDGRDIQLGTGTGTKIGTSTSQKLAFYGSTPVVQQARPTDAASIITTGTTLGLWA